eukprot:scaffold124252_cov30-Tisochrysis_lutea.AAC.1
MYVEEEDPAPDMARPATTPCLAPLNKGNKDYQPANCPWDATMMGRGCPWNSSGGTSDDRVPAAASFTLPGTARARRPKKGCSLSSARLTGLVPPPPSPGVTGVRAIARA